MLPRKWRPKNFDELIGQNHITQFFRNAVERERVPHALLFTGPRGTGKTSTARILSKVLRCPQKKGLLPCNTCAECVSISKGVSVDVMEIDGASNNGVEAIRDLRDTVYYVSSLGKYKVYIIDEVHMLTMSAFNALLKTLEEPPKHIVFIMATTEVHKVPQTIRSRCQRFDFRRIPTHLILEQLNKVCEVEKLHPEEKALWIIAKRAEGSLRDGLGLLDQMVTLCGDKFKGDEVVDLLGLTQREILRETLRCLVEQDSDKTLQVLKKVVDFGYDFHLYMREILEEVRNLLVVKMSNDRKEDILNISKSERLDLEQLTEKISAEDLHILFDMALKGENEVRKSLDPQTVLEMSLLRMVEAPRVKDLSYFLEMSRKNQKNDYLIEKGGADV